MVTVVLVVISIYVDALMAILKMSERKKIYYHFASDPSREYTLNLPCEGRVSCKFARQHIIIQHTVRPDSKCFFELYRNVSTDAGNPKYKLIDSNEDILTETRLLVKRRPITAEDIKHDEYLSFDSLAPTLHDIIHSDMVADKLSAHNSDSLIDANRQGVTELTKDLLTTLLSEIDNNLTMTIGKNTRTDIIGQFNIDNSPPTAREGQQFLIGQANRIHQTFSKNQVNEEEQDEDEDDKEKTTSNIAELWDKVMGYPKSFICPTKLRESAQTPASNSTTSGSAGHSGGHGGHSAHSSTFSGTHVHANSPGAHNVPGSVPNAHAPGYDHRQDFRQNDNRASGQHFQHNKKPRDFSKEHIKVVLTGIREKK